MSNKSHKKQAKTKKITRETVIIAGLICFMAGYATHSLIVSYQNFGSDVQPQQQISQQNTQQNTVQAPAVVDDSALLKKVKDNPNDLQSWIQLGNLYFDSGNNEQAITAYTSALDLDSQNADVQTDLGIMYRRTGQISEAIQSFNKAREIDPSHGMSAFNKGIVFLYDMGNTEGALDIWKQLLRENPDFMMPNGMRLSDFLKTVN